MSEIKEFAVEVAKSGLRQGGAVTVGVAGTIVAGPVGGLVAAGVYYLGLSSQKPSAEEKSRS